MKIINDYKNIRSENDIAIAKEKLKYSIMLQEEILSKSFNNLRNSIFDSLRVSLWKFGIRIAADVLIKQIQSRISDKK